jgi:hypothetical protein
MLTPDLLALLHPSSEHPLRISRSFTKDFFGRLFSFQEKTVPRDVRAARGKMGDGRESSYLVQPITHYVIYYLDIEIVIDEPVDEHEDQPEV